MFNPWQPWKEEQRKYPPKHAEYFHQRDGIWNSLVHSSPKIAQFYLKPNLEFTIKNSTSQTTLPSEENTARNTESRERIKRRKLEREILQAKSSQCLPGFILKEDMQPVFTTFKDPASRPISKQIGRFENYNELPEDRLKLVVNKKILKKDSEALSLISKKLAKELGEEAQRKEWHMAIRQQTLTRMKNKRDYNQVYEEKTGLEKIKFGHKTSTPLPSARIQSLSLAKGVKVGYPEDYAETFGLLKAGTLYSGKSVHPKSARKPMVKKSETYPIQVDDKTGGLIAFEQKDNEIKYEEEILTEQEIKESMRELNEFNKRFGELKGRVGFPQIYLEKYKNL